MRKTLFLGSVGAGIYALFALRLGSAGTRYSFGTGFDPNDIAYVLLSFLPFNFIFFSKENSLGKRFFCLVNITASIVLILFSGSRGGFVSLMVVLLTLFLFARLVSRSIKILSIAGFFAFALFGLSQVNVERYKTIGNIGNDYNVTDEYGRLAIWRNGLDLVLSNPLAGVGAGCFRQAIGENRQSKSLVPRWQESHNSLIQIASETGVIGLLLYVILTVRAFAIFAKARNYGRSKDLSEIGEAALIGFLGNFMASMFLSQAYSVYFGFYIALSAVLLRLIEEPNLTEPGVMGWPPRTKR